MELVEGENARDWLQEKRRAGEILDVYRAAGRGLAAAHAAGLVHRDFKPDNVLVGEDARVRVTDFGLAHGRTAGEDGPLARLPDKPDPGALATRLTLSGSLMGTPAYMAPEQLECRPASDKSDQFSFCVTLYEALYDERPFAGETIVEITETVTGGRVRPAPAGSPVPPEIRRALLRGMAVDPAERWPSMEALLEALGHDPSGRLRRMAIATGALCLLAALGLAADYAVQAQAEDRIEDRLAAARERLGRAVARRHEVFRAAAELSYVAPLMRELIRRDEADFGLGSDTTDQTRLEELHQNLEDADWKPLSEAAQTGPVAILDYKGRVLWSSAARDAFGSDARIVPAVAQAFAGESGAGLVAGDDPLLRQAGLFSAARPGRWLVAARSTVLVDVPRLAFVQLFEAQGILDEVAGEPLAAALGDGKTQLPAGWPTASETITWPGVPEPPAQVSFAHPPATGLFAQARLIFALALGGLCLLFARALLALSRRPA
jgi:hypothetical protein